MHISFREKDYLTVSLQKTEISAFACNLSVYIIK